MGKVVFFMQKIKLLEHIASLPVTEETLSDAFAVIIELEDREDIHKWCVWVRKNARKIISHDMYDLFYKTYLFEAQKGDFEAYCIYLEKNREPDKKFYMPRRKQLKVLVQDLQDLFDHKIDFLGVSLPPRVGKSTLCIFYMTFVMGHRPEIANVMSGHSSALTDGFYGEILNIITTPEDYLWQDVFPGVELVNKSAKNLTVDLAKRRRFPSITCRSIGGTLTGAVEIGNEGVLYCDDLIGGIEEALNKARLDTLWNIYSVDARQRKLNEQVKEIHIATRWSVHDVIGRLKSLFGDSSRARFIAIPDIDPVTGESNFAYKYNGMSKEFFESQALVMDDVSYRCLYKNEPIEREGLLYKDDELRRYASLPHREPDAIIGVCDTKTTGVDYMVLPVFYQYDNDFYLVDCICDDTTDFGMQQERLSNIIVNHKMQQCEFESNAGGSRLAHEINKIVEEKGGRCNITTKATETNKETRIIVNSDWIKKHCLFKEREDYKPKSDYGVLMNFLLSYSVAGKNKFDDVPDCLANFALYVARKDRIRSTVIIECPF
jgi:predicted phage terminase large subunit-like protein